MKKKRTVLLLKSVTDTPLEKMLTVPPTLLTDRPLEEKQVRGEEIGLRKLLLSDLMTQIENC